MTQIYFPGLTSDPGYDLMKRQQSGPGAMLSFEVKTPELASHVMESVKLFSLAASLGGVESLICQPATMTHRAMSDEAQHAAGLTEKLIRLSVGLEHVDDLIADLAQALTSV